MTKAIAWATATYCVFKLAGIIFAKPPGYRLTDPTPKERLLWGEPIIIIASLLIGISGCLLLSGYSNRTYSRIFKNSSTCYGRIMALRDITDLRSSTGALAAYEQIEGYRNFAFVTGKNLGIAPEEIGKILDRKTEFFAEQYDLSQKSGMEQEKRRQVYSMLRCVHPPQDGSNM